MGPKIVVIDDSAVMLDTMKRILPVYLPGSEVIATGPEDLGDLPSDVNVFLVDYKMDIIGPDVVRELITSYPNAKFIGWSTNLDSEKKKKFEKAGTDATILKGVSMSQLAELIEALLWE